MLLMIDNYDSFTYNLVHYFKELQAEVCVLRNDAVDVEAIAAMQPTHIVISPGPGRPANAGICMEVIRHFGPTTPLLGVCLGHQCIAEALGGKTVHAARVMHGKTSLVQHKASGVFHGLEAPLVATRYHSLVTDPGSLPDELEVNAWSDDSEQPREVMGIRHRHWPMHGVQFHPESVLSQQGHQLLDNFLALSGV